MNDPAEMTALLRRYAEGDRAAFDELAPQIYDHLRRIASSQLAQKRRNTLDTTALVHEAYLRLAGQDDPHWRDRDHFFAAAAQAMRHILVDAARRRLTQKRGAGESAVTLEDEVLPLEEVEDHCARVLAVHEALGQLREIDETLCRVVECRYFAGYSATETAAALGVSERTAHRYWLRARSWLKLELAGEGVGKLEAGELEEFGASAMSGES